MSCPWGKISAPEPVNLQEIMSEEIARDLQAKEVEKYAEIVNDTTPDHFEIPQEILEQVGEDVCDSDAVIANMLQRQFDKEYDEMLKRTEDKYNGTSKVSVSLEKFKRMPLHEGDESDSDEEDLEDLLDKKDWDRFDTVNREFKAIPPCGYMMKDGNMVTKHDVTNNARRNACKMMSFPPEFQTGDGAGFDLKLSNKVFNSLRAHSEHAKNRRHRMHDKREDQATAEFGVDSDTRLLLYKMVNNQLLEKVNGVISIGKEAVILHADSDAACEETVPKECAIKVFKTTLSEFKQRDKYIRDDYRFKGRIGKQNTKKIIQLWAEKEMHNLHRLQRAGIPCPDVVTLKRHVLVMSFIGSQHNPAPKLKYAILDEAQYIMAYEQVTENMKNLYLKANLIHADLSEYNILWYNDTCYFIDVSQAVEPSHENAFHFLMRDCDNVINFFGRKHVPEIMTAGELFTTITGCDFNDKIALLALQESFKMKPHLVDKPGNDSSYNFENAWEMCKTKAIESEAVESLIVQA